MYAAHELISKSLKIINRIVILISICSSGALLASGLPETISAIKPAIVGIGSVHPTRAQRAQLKGTGFVVGDGHHIITNAHVVSQALDTEHKEVLAVFIGTGPTPIGRRARKVLVDSDHDLVVLKIDGKPLPAMTLAEPGNVREGQLYAFTGFPIGAVLGLYPATHRGIISAITPIVTPANQSKQLSVSQIKRLRDPYKVFQLDATAYPGNSGSPLFNPDTGEVVGVVNMVFVKGTKENVLTKPSGISYAIPVKYVRDLLDKLE